MSEIPESILQKPSALARLRTYFLTGLVIVAPLGITIYLVWSFIGWVDGWVKPYLPHIYNPDTYLPFPVPGLGLFVALFGITMVGFLTANIIGRSIVRWGEYLLLKMPFVRNIYNGLKQIFQTVLSEKSNSFKQVAIIEYPRRGLYALVFVATEAQGEVQEKLEETIGETIAVFLPTTPNPTSGFLLYVPRSDLVPLSMSVEDGAKLVISAGLVTPDYQRKLRDLAAREGVKIPAETPEEPAA